MKPSEIWDHRATITSKSRKHRNLQGGTGQDRLGLPWVWCYQILHKLVRKILLKISTIASWEHRMPESSRQKMEITPLSVLCSTDLKTRSPQTVRARWQSWESHPSIWGRGRGRAATVGRSWRRAWVLLSLSPKEHRP